MSWQTPHYGTAPDPAAYDPEVDRSSPTAAQSAAEVSGALAGRTSELSADIYDLIVREIPQLALLASQWLGAAVLREGETQ
jgi:hypothetical protein